MIEVKKFKPERKKKNSPFKVTRTWVLKNANNLYLCRNCNQADDCTNDNRCCDRRDTITGYYRINTLFQIRYSKLIDESKKAIRFIYIGKLLGGDSKCNADSAK